MITIESLAKIEQLLQHALGRDDAFVLGDYFDYMAGTSTGAILATCLSLGWRVERVRKFYHTQGKEMFDRASLFQRFRTKKLFQSKTCDQTITLLDSCIAHIRRVFMDTNTQPTRWEVPDDVWTLIEPIRNACDPATPKGPRRVDLRPGLNGIIFRLRTGCPWHQLPKLFGDDRTVHRHCQHWCPRGILARMGAVLVATCHAWGGVDGPWPAAAAMGAARRGGALVGRNPADRGHKG